MMSVGGFMSISGSATFWIEDGVAYFRTSVMALKTSPGIFTPPVKALSSSHVSTFLQPAHPGAFSTWILLSSTLIAALLLMTAACRRQRIGESVPEEIIFGASHRVNKTPISIGLGSYASQSTAREHGACRSGSDAWL